MLSYHTSSLQGAARAVENPDIVASIMAKPRRGDVLDLTIDDLAFGGEGVGRVQGYVIFVRGAIPGDHVRVRIVEAHVVDRKSTRLNSSHVAISYAVFCLKKKKNH